MESQPLRIITHMYFFVYSDIPLFVPQPPDFTNGENEVHRKKCAKPWLKLTYGSFYQLEVL